MGDVAVYNEVTSGKRLEKMVNPNDSMESCTANRRQGWIHFEVVHLLSSEHLSHMCPAQNLDSYKEGLLRDWE